MENCGITTAEAMSAGCIPVVINKGGQVEIVAEGSGFRWNTLEELVSFTEQICGGSFDEEKITREAQNRSKDFSKEAFTNQLRDFFASKNLL